MRNWSQASACSDHLVYLLRLDPARHGNFDFAMHGIAAKAAVCLRHAPLKRGIDISWRTTADVG